MSAICVRKHRVLTWSKLSCNWPQEIIEWLYLTWPGIFVRGAAVTVAATTGSVAQYRCWNRCCLKEPSLLALVNWCGAKADVGRSVYLVKACYGIRFRHTNVSHLKNGSNTQEDIVDDHAVFTLCCSSNAIRVPVCKTAGAACRIPV